MLSSNDISRLQRGDKLIFVKDFSSPIRFKDSVCLYSNMVGDDKVPTHFQCIEILKTGNTSHSLPLNCVELFDYKKHKDYVLLEDILPGRKKNIENKIMDGFFMVFLKNGRCPTFKHPTLESAETEAKRLSEIFGREAYVLCTLKKVSVKIEDCRPPIDDLPF